MSNSGPLTRMGAAVPVPTRVRVPQSAARRYDPPGQPGDLAVPMDDSPEAYLLGVTVGAWRRAVVAVESGTDPAVVLGELLTRLGRAADMVDRLPPAVQAVVITGAQVQGRTDGVVIPYWRQHPQPIQAGPDTPENPCWVCQTAGHCGHCSCCPRR